MLVRTSFLIALLLLSLPAAAQLSDENADARHFFPLFMDGGGFRSRLILTNATHTANQCVLDFGGQALNAGAFEPHAALSAAGASANVALPAGIGANMSLVSRGERMRAAFGYAQLNAKGRCSPA